MNDSRKKLKRGLDKFRNIVAITIAMQRRNFIQQSALAGAAFFTPAFSFSNNKQTPFAEKPFHLDYAPHDGMFLASAGASFLDQIKYSYDMGFRAIEDNGFMDRPVKEQEAIGSLLGK